MQNWLISNMHLTADDERIIHSLKTWFIWEILPPEIIIVHQIQIDLESKITILCQSCHQRYHQNLSPPNNLHKSNSDLFWCQCHTSHHHPLRHHLHPIRHPLLLASSSHQLLVHPNNNSPIMSTLTSSSYQSGYGYGPNHHHHHHTHGVYFTNKTPKRYFNLGLFCCCTAGFVFTFGLVLMVWGSSPHEPNAIWIAGIVFLFTGGFLFFMGIGSIGLYLNREDRRKKREEIERARARQYAASLTSARSLTRSSDVYLID